MFLSKVNACCCVTKTSEIHLNGTIIKLKTASFSCLYKIEKLAVR